MQDSQLLEEPYEAPPSFQTADEFAYQALRSMILNGTLSGGTRLNQDDLARRRTDEASCARTDATPGLGIAEIPAARGRDVDPILEQHRGAGDDVKYIGPSERLGDADGLSLDERPHPIGAVAPERRGEDNASVPGQGS